MHSITHFAVSQKISHHTPLMESGSDTRAATTKTCGQQQAISRSLTIPFELARLPKHVRELCLRVSWKPLSLEIDCSTDGSRCALGLLLTTCPADLQTELRCAWDICPTSKGIDVVSQMRLQGSISEGAKRRCRNCRGTSRSLAMLC